MTPDFLLDEIFQQGAGAAVQVPDEARWAPLTGNSRITRGAVADQTLVAVVGLGYAGLPNALALRRAGMRVVAIDTSASRLTTIRNGRADLLDVPGEELSERLHDEDFVLSDSLEQVHEADAVLICVPAIVDAERRPSLEALKGTCAAVVANARERQTLVLTSASYVGTTRELLVEPLGERGLHVGEDVFVAFSPERIDPGVSEHAQAQTARVVGALSESCYAHARHVLEPLAGSLHRVSSAEAAEMSKLYESTFRAVNVALACEMADACVMHSLDPNEVLEAAASKPFGFLAHRPSAGAGGHGVAVDPYHLLAPLRERGRPAVVAERAMQLLAERPLQIAHLAHQLLLSSGERMRDVRVLVVGAAYKPGLADCFGSPALEVIRWLSAEDVHVEYHDPLVPVLDIDGEQLHSVDPDPRRDASGFGPEDYDLAILITVHPGHDYGWLRRVEQVLDCTYGEPTGRRYILP